MKSTITTLSVFVMQWLFINVGFAQNNLVKISDDYQRFGLKETNIPEKWEDGMRSTGKEGTYEWWYFDAHLKDGSTVVVVFFTKSFIDLNQQLNPLIRIEINKSDGTKIGKTFEFDAKDFYASKDSCNVNIGKNYFRGNLKEYEIHLQEENIKLTAKVKRTTDSWRPKTGHMVFGLDENKFFNWVVAVPNGDVELTYTYNNTTISLAGSCYHDHNWGNIGMMKLFNHWYWSRAEIGPYNVIAAEMISEKEYENKKTIVFNISKDGKTIADNGEDVKLYRTLGKIHPRLNKDISDDLLFVYSSTEDEYRYEYYLYREKNIVEVDLLKATMGEGLKYRIAKLITGFDGAYFRFTGKSEIKVYQGDKLIEKHVSTKAVWELMYFGKSIDR